MSGAAEARWTGFLQQIRERHAAVCAEAEEGTRAALAATEYDFIPISHAWMAVTDRLKELERRIIDTWIAKVESVFESEGVDRDTIKRQRRRGEDLAFELENLREETEMRAYANGAREIHKRALATQAEHKCRQCGAPLPIPVTYRAVNIPCPHCRTLCTFEPGTLARVAMASGSHGMAREAAHAEWLAMRNAERAIHDTRSPTPFALLKAYEQAQIAYWRKYIAMRAQLEPELQDLALEVRSRMQFWWTQVESESEWRRAGSPREQI
ncbi:MAG TPA: hypothetical protein VGH28_14280 [Polyangiaceae bacterium]|jgi:hypothetical protein